MVIGTGTSDIRRDDIDRVMTVLRTGRLSAGPFMASFERNFAEMHGARFASMCNSGTGALQLAIQALKERYRWPNGSEVIVPAMTFVATINAVLFNGLKPVLADIDPITFNIDPDEIERVLTPNTVAIIPVHLFGQPAAMVPIMEIAARYDLSVIEDSCEAAGVRHRGQPVGSFGDFAAFSTYMAHVVTTGVGGLALTNDEENARRFRSLMNHGRNPIYTRIDDGRDPTDADFLRTVFARYEFTSIGQSFRATEMEAALGIGQLQRLPETIRRRNQVAGWLADRLPADRLQLPVIAEGNEHAWMMYPIVCRDPADRDTLVVALERAGVETRLLMPILDQPCYERMFQTEDYPVAKQRLDDGLFVGCHQGMTPKDTDYIADVVKAALA